MKSLRYGLLRFFQLYVFIAHYGLSQGLALRPPLYEKWETSKKEQTAK